MAVFYFLTASLTAQTYVNQTWQMQAGSPNLSVDWSQTFTSTNGEVVIVGNTLNATQMTNIYLMKYDEGGNLLWDVEFNGAISGDDYGTGVTVDGLGNIFVSGVVSNNQNDGFDYVVLHYDDQGVLQWQYIYDAFGEDDISADIALTANGDIIVTGTSYKTASLNDYLTIMVDGGGSFMWASRYDYVSLDDGAIKAKVINSNKIVITGGSQSTATSFDAATVTYDGNGNQLGVERQNSLTISQANALDTDNLGNIYITGFKDNASGNTDLFTTKLDSDLVIQWTKTHDEAGFNDAAEDIFIDGSYNVYVTGNVINTNGTSNVKTIKYNSSGAMVWEKNFKPMDNQTVFSDIDMAWNNGDDIGITCAKHLNGNTVVLTIIYDTDGNLKWNKEFSISNQEVPAQITSSPSGFNVTGISGNSTKAYFVVSYATFTRTRDPLLGSNGLPKYEKNELIVDFLSSEIITTTVDDENVRFGNLGTFFKPSLVTEIGDLIGEVVNLNEVKVTRVFGNLKTNKKISITREGNEIMIPHFWSTFLLTFPDGTSVSNLTQVLTNSSLVHLASLNTYAELSSTANDTWYSSYQHSLQSSAHPDGDINIEGAWDITTGKEFVKVGIVDIGVNYLHQDFDVNGGSRVKGGYDYDYNADFTDPQLVWDKSGHGTRVAGIIGANRNDGFGVAGIAGGDSLIGGVSLYSIKIGQYLGPNSYNILLENIIWGIVDGATSEGTATSSAYGEGYGLHIMNHSYGTIDSIVTVDSANLVMLEKAIRFAFRNGVINVAARGNKDNNANSYPQYPACFDDNLIINVGGSNVDGIWWDAPGTGAAIGHGIDVAGPAQSLDSNNSPLIFTTTADFDNSNTIYHYQFGATSAATPHVTGVVALMLSHVNQDGCKTNLSVEDVEYLLENNAVFKETIPNTTAPDEYTGYGLIDATATLEAMEMPVYRIKHFSTLIDSNHVETFFPKESGWTTRYFSSLHGSFSDFTDGYYPSKWYKYNGTKFFTVDPTETIIDTWPRYSSTNLFPTEVGPSDTVFNVFGASNYSFNPNQPWVTMEGYAYKIDLGNGNYAWFPEELNNGLPINVSFSVYTRDDNATTYSYPCNPPLGQHKVELPSHDISVFPNPTSKESTNLKYTVSKNGLVKITLFDSMGRFIKTILNEKQNSGSQFIKISLDGLTNGIYFLHFESDEINGTQKIIITK